MNNTTSRLNSFDMYLSGILYPGDNDVMLGRGGEANTHKGNAKFREIAQSYRGMYKEAPKSLKPSIAAEIVAVWRSLNPPGRFLIKTDPRCPDSLWHDVGDRLAIRRAAKTLGERSREERIQRKSRQRLRKGAGQTQENFGSAIGSHSYHESSQELSSSEASSFGSDDADKKMPATCRGRTPKELAPSEGPANSKLSPDDSVETIASNTNLSISSGFLHQMLGIEPGPRHFSGTDGHVKRSASYGDLPTAAYLAETAFSDFEEDNEATQDSDSVWFNEDLRRL